MSKMHRKIGEGLRKLVHKDAEIMSGTVVAGSVDTSEYTMMVLPTNGSNAIGPVMLNGIAENGKGLILIPKDESDVVIGCVDGPGEWTLIRASDIVKCLITIGGVVFEMTDSHVKATQGAAVLTMSGGMFSLKNGTKDFKTVMNNVLEHIMALTVITAVGPSTPPVNVAAFGTDLGDINTLFS